MKIYKLTELSDGDHGGEYTLELSCASGLYVKYLRFRQLEEKKQLNPKSGFKGLVYVIKGELKITSKNDDFPVSVGESFELDGGTDLYGENISSGESLLLITCGPSSSPEDKLKEALNELEEEDQ